MHRSLQHWQRAVREAALNMENDMRDELIPHLKERIATMQEALGKAVARELELETELAALEKNRDEWRDDAINIAERSGQQSATIEQLTERNRQLETALVDLSDKLMRAHRVEMERAEYRIEQYLADLVRRIPR